MASASIGPLRRVRLALFSISRKNLPPEGEDRLQYYWLV
jgi:hypothetical protein